MKDSRLKVRPKGRNKIRKYQFIIFGFVFVVLYFLFSCDNVREAPQYRIVKVMDGDTVGLANWAKVRLLGIDCPEMRDNAKLLADSRTSGQNTDFIKKQGARAFEFTRELLLYKKVLVEFDKNKKDKYGRWLAYLWIELGEPGSSQNSNIPSDYVKVLRKKSDGHNAEFIFVNATILKAGFARPLNIPPNLRYENMFEQLYQQALKEKRGLWGGV